CMDKSSFTADESSVRHHEDLLSSTILVGDEDHKRDELKLSPIFGDTSPSGKVGLRYRNAHVIKEEDDSGDREDSDKLSSTNALGISLDFVSGYSSEAQDDMSQIDVGDAGFIEEKEGPSTSSSNEPFRTPQSSHSGTRLETESKRVVNPFDKSVCAESLSRSIFSPGILAELSNLPKNTPKTAIKGEFKWSIEHLAVLNPIDFPEEDIIRSRISPSSFHDPSRQAAIETFFRSNAAYHPSPDIFRKPPTPLAAPSAKRVRQTDGHPFQLPSSSSSSILQPSPLTRPPAARILRTTQFQRVRTFSTQTLLTIPPSEDIDLLALLGGQFVFNEDADRQARISEGIEEDEEEERDLSASNLSLRRRLFLNDGDDEEDELETSAVAHEREDILTPLSSDHSSPSIPNGNRSSSSQLEDLGSGSSGDNHLATPSISRIARMPLPFPDFSPIAPNS
ncbi:hypothetical protein PENTCL1PPCAC_17446, partial [Pristionchus entomophagus]